MKKRFLLLIIFPVILFADRCAMSQESPYDAIYLSQTREFILNKDGSMVQRYSKIQKLQTYRSFHNLYGETFIVFNPLFQKLKIDEAYTIMADGKKVPAPENSFNEVLPGFAANAPAFNALREMVITHTGLERNSVIHLDYQVQTEKGFFPALMGNELLAENEPVEGMQVIIRIPEGMILSYRLFNSDVQPEKKVINDYQVFTWNFVNIPAISAEEYQCGGTALYPRLIFSTSGDRAGIVAFLTNQDAFRFEFPNLLKREVDKLAAENQNPFELALKLQEKVINELRLFSVPMKYTGYLCRTTEQTVQGSGGTLLEKAVLLTSLLRYSGMDALPVAVVRSNFYDEKIGTLADIEDFMVRVDLKDAGGQYLPVTALNQVNPGVSMPDRIFLVLDPIKKAWIQKPVKERSRINMNGVFLVSSDPKMTGELTIDLEGNVVPYPGLIRDKNKIKNSLAGGLKAGDVKEIKVDKSAPGSAHQVMIFQSDKPFRKDSNFYFFTIPSLVTGIDGWGIKALSSRRETPYEIPYAAEEEYTFEFTLPSGMSLFTPETKRSSVNKAGSFLWEISVEKGRVIVRRLIHFEKTAFSQQDYADFKELMDQWNNPRYREIIFTVKK
jgi:hypothetical protein